MPTHATNGHAGPGAANGDELAVAAERAPEASERATSSVLALDGWGRLEPEPHINGATPTAAEPQPAPQLEPEPEPKTEPPLESELEPPPLSAAASRRRAVNPGEQPLARLIEEAQRRQWVGEQPLARLIEEAQRRQWVGEQPLARLIEEAQRRQWVGEQPLARLIEEAQRRQWVGEQPGPGLRLFGSALVFGLAVGAVVGAALRWLELRSAPPAPPPPDDLAERLHRAWLAFSMVEGQGEGQTPHSRRPS